VHLGRRSNITAITVKLNLEKETVKRPEIWPNVWIFRHDNAPAQEALDLEQLVVKKSITKIEHPP